ncbi:hypothetical protein TREMEDRAFT_29190 [Tremella mesenterica DSM 1558]|uniref:uncharacterized protein n=1 Tax=Tremella mesenterica (strain ATCC 24925 / CBS 8224 / DSM 1558 / NBRC 9311 / NRRL Y-6157 / RJB 2259-6 / UBC 559-6) TaxID=578456 RepID=UPI0003F4946E|nr:uncharacterized protein TREMEDRAFT_29190 [Tremella mesenterica DSM 1558]EIW70438.1 hypothetical protein TREMEDRAFT_29190 [Tremella mesenterica DSM 1558]
MVTDVVSPFPSSSKDTVLSIQSHVVSGYVGNRAATFPLQLLGYEVDVVNTVHFSNHTGYGRFKGHKTTPDELQDIFDGLRVNGLLTHSRVLTGYIPGAEALQVIAQEIKSMRHVNPDLCYLLDPVMGDVDRGLYVSPSVVPVYKQMLSLATIITPNQFEIETLTSVPIDSLPALHQALRLLHTEYHIPHVVCSSIPLKANSLAGLALPSPPPSYTQFVPSPTPPWYDALGSDKATDEVLVCFASSWNGGKMRTWAYPLPTIRAAFTGTGDILSAMILGHYSPNVSCPLPHAVSKALSVVQQVLLRTHLHSLSQTTQSQETTHPLSSPLRRSQEARKRELRLVQEQALISNSSEHWPGCEVPWDAIHLRS